jgi:membrane-bound lytic murein transglycosylase D
MNKYSEGKVWKLLVLLVFSGLAAIGQTEVIDWNAPRVHHTLTLGNMQLHLTEQARRDIQADVDALYRSPKFFQLKVEKVDMYMPIIEPILAQYKVPNEFKYLVIQESGLVPDAVSSSNAVGYWQFKEASATELGMRVDRQIDDRMNIVAATEGAMKYLLRSNEAFDNWVYSLLSYNVGLGGATRSLDAKYYGAKQLKIDHNTHWYVKKFLSHLVAFEPALNRLPRQIMLYQYTNTAGKTLEQIAGEFAMDEPAIEAYNKWLLTRRVPGDKQYTVVVPLRLDESEELQIAQNENPTSERKKALEELQFGRLQKGPETYNAPTNGPRTFTEINGLRATVARPGDKITLLAEAGNVSVYNFIRWNDLSPSSKIQPGQVYYFRKKKNKATVYKHTTQPGQTLWQVAQQYGIKEKKLRQKNRMNKTEQPEAGQILWLRYIRPNNQEIEFDEEVRKAAALKKEAKPESNAGAVTREAKSTLYAQAAVTENVKRLDQHLENSKVKVVNRVALDTPQVDTLKKNDTLQDKSNDKTSLSKPAQLYPTTEEASRNIPGQIEEKPQETDLTFYSEGEAEFETEDPVVFIDEDNSTNDTGIISSPSSSPVPTLEEQNVPVEYHEVKAGETLYAISKKYNLSVSKLRELNQLTEQDALRIGQRLRVIETEAEQQEAGEQPSSRSSEPDISNDSTVNQEAIYHTVAEGETMYRVARQYNVTIKDIMEWNQREDFNIKPGEKLLVKPAK